MKQENLKKILENKYKEKFKDYNIKKKDYIYYYCNNNMFYSMYFFTIKNNIKVIFNAKPLWADDILWDILKMSENKNESISLRGTGAYTINYKINENNYLIENENEVDNIIDNTFKNFISLSKSYNEEKFLNNYCNNNYQNNVLDVIILIHNNEYNKALDYLNKNEINDFSIKNKNFSELAINYINNKR